GIRYRRTTMSVTPIAADGGLSLTGENISYVVVAAAIGRVAPGFAAALVQSVLKARRGTTTMQEISGAVQEGASAYVFRQLKTVSVFVLLAVILLFVLPVHDVGGSEIAVKIGRSVFFVVGAAFSAFIGA